jgi:predicted MFS family arabinose efflux permease
MRIMSFRLELFGFTIAGTSMVAVTYGLARYTIGLFVPDIRLEMSLSAPEIGFIISGSYFGYLVATLFGTTLAVRLGPKPVILAGGIAAASGMIMMGFGTSPAILALGVVLAGMSPGLSYPPLSEVIVANVEPHRQNVVYGWINSGTGFGVAVSAPIALMSSLDWRSAYFMFASIAALSTVLCLLFLQNSRRPAAHAASPVSHRRMLWSTRGVPLFLSSLIFGVCSSAYWAFAIDLLYIANGSDTTRTVFWSILGISGAIGLVAGTLVNKVGLRKANCLALAIVGGAIMMLPLVTGNNTGIFLSAVLFGGGFVTATAIIGIWSMTLFPSAPIGAFGLAFFLISLGQGIGPVIVGYGRAFFGTGNTFVFDGAVTVAIALLMVPVRALASPAGSQC